jgi:hypothetical protein
MHVKYNLELKKLKIYILLYFILCITDMSSITVTIDLARYPLLINTDIRINIDDIIRNLIDIGYDTKFGLTTVITPNSVEPLTIESSIYNHIASLHKRTEKTEDTMTELTTTLHKLIGISSNSAKKGGFAEGILEHTFKMRYGDIRFEAKNQTAHSADAWLHLPDNQIIMLESKNYTNTVSKKELEKFEADMITHNIHWGILISFNSPISGMRELDYYVFTHNKQTYVIFIISNIQNVDDFHRLLDLGLQLMRRHIQLDKQHIKLDYVVQDITAALTDLHKLIAKNNTLRDAFYNMEREIHKSTNEYYGILRNYQYEIDTTIRHIIQKVDVVMCDSAQSIMDGLYHGIGSTTPNKEIANIVSRIIDTCIPKGWKLVTGSNTDSTPKFVTENGSTIASMKIQSKKVVIIIHDRDLEIAFCIGKEQNVLHNLEMLRGYTV